MEILLQEVRDENIFEKRLFHQLVYPQRWELPFQITIVLLIALMIIIMFIQPYVFLLWLFIGFLIYSYNFIILLIPTTNTKIRVNERKRVDKVCKQSRWSIARSLYDNKRLAMEIGLTVFLNGMVPLVWSFTIIFGVTAFFTTYYGIVTDFITWHTTTTIFLQITFIFILYFLIFLLEPRTYGISKLIAQSKGKTSDNSLLRSIAIITLATVILIGFLASLLGFWAALLPAVTLTALMEAYDLLGRFDIVLFIIVLSAQLLVMRYMQSYASRNRIIKILALRIKILNDIEIDLASLSSYDDDLLADFQEQFYSVMAYDITEHDIYGTFPVYLIYPRFKYILNSVSSGDINCSSLNFL